MDAPIQDEISKSANCQLKMTFLTVGIYFASWVSWGITMRWCNVNLVIVLPLIIPLLWSIYLLCSYRTAIGRIGSWFSFFLACYYLLAGCAMVDFSLF
jgi:hypothetical protein